ncbi:MAG: hypothetical protein RL111_2358 [Pseudomonadota bacterium]|jgi:uracil-DNA glycosylase
MAQTDLFAAATGGDTLSRSTWAHWANPPGLQPGWVNIWQSWASSTQGRDLAFQLDAALAAGQTVYPPEPWQALTLTDLAAVRVVVLGQDPYHGPGQAHGLAFSVAHGVPIPPSLRNIRQECERTEGVSLPSHGNLSAWAKRGVLLLNTTWTVSEALPASHAKWGWDALTHRVLDAVWQSAGPLVCLAWGAHAQHVVAQVAQRNPGHRAARLVLQANHPSPLSARRPPTPFVGCDHFRITREWLQDQGVAWTWAFD